jgi:RNA polymerase sigma-70 factor (ECF subfamily)
MPFRAQIDRLYDDHAGPLFGFLLNLTRNEADTRDLLQEVFVKLARRPDLLEGVLDCRAFLLRLAHNLAIDLIRRRASQDRNYEQMSADIADSPFAPAAEPDSEAFRHALESALGNLPPEQRVAVHLKLWEGLTFEQIGEVLDVPANTAASRYRYGIDKLRDLLRPIYEEIK